jgi:hypothetical protein
MIKYETTVHLNKSHKQKGGKDYGNLINKKKKNQKKNQKK